MPRNALYFTKWFCHVIFTLMPTSCYRHWSYGHPFSQVYKEAIKSLKEAASSAAVTVNLNVCSGYLNEVISHRNLAITYYNEAGSDFGRIARSDALYNGVSNLNVFVGAYANWANQHGEVDF